MAKLGAVSVVVAPRGEGRTVRALIAFYKADYPRPIDRIIDFFGERPASADVSLPGAA
jgi:hypothetical protein